MHPTSVMAVLASGAATAPERAVLGSGSAGPRNVELEDDPGAPRPEPEIGWAGVNRRVISAKKGQALQLAHAKGGPRSPPAAPPGATPARRAPVVRHAPSSGSGSAGRAGGLRIVRGQPPLPANAA